MDNQALDPVAKRIKQRRQELGLSLQNVADETGISRSTLQRYETGGIKNIPIKRLKGLANALKTTSEWIMGTDESSWYSNALSIYEEMDWGPIQPPKDLAITIQKDCELLLPYAETPEAIMLAFLSKDEELLVYYYRYLTEEAKHKIREYLGDLFENAKYVNSEKLSKREHKQKIKEYLKDSTEDS